MLEKLGEHGYVAIFLDVDPDYGIAAGKEWERALYHHLAVCRAVIALCSAAFMRSRWCFAEVVQAKALGKEIFPVKIEPCDPHDLLASRQVIDLSEGEKAWARLWAGLRQAGLDPNDSFDWDVTRPPYPGFDFFGVKDAWVYFGRDKETKKALEILNQMRRHGEKSLALVLGASGCGKSSLLRAGIVARLHKDVERWFVVPPFRPRGQPLTEFAKAIAEGCRAVVPLGWEHLLNCWLRSSAEEIIEEVDSATSRTAAREAAALLVVDQLEELVLESSSDRMEREAGQQRHLFLKVLAKLACNPGGRIYVIGSLRSDRLGAFQTHPLLPGVPFETIQVGPMPRENFGQIIAGPAERAGVRLEPGLVERMIAHAASDDALPLLAFTLFRMHKKCVQLHQEFGVQMRFTHAIYDEVGGIERVVEDALHSIPRLKEISPNLERDLRSAFLQLAQINEDGKHIRRIARTEEFPATVPHLLEGFVEARLLARDREEWEVVHESLFRVWEKLRGWLEESREIMLWEQRIRGEVKDWRRKGSPANLLLREGRLAEAQTMLARSAGQLNPEIEKFIVESSQLRDREEEQKREMERDLRMAQQARADEAEKRQQEAEKRQQAEAKAAKSLRRLAFVLAAVALAAAAAAFFGYWQKTEARRAASQAHVSLARQLKESGNNAQAMAHLAKALKLNYKNDEATALTGAMLAQNNWPLSIGGPILHFLVISFAQFDPDGQGVPAGLFDKIAGLGKPGKPVGEKHDALVHSAQFSPDGQRVVTGSLDKTARLWDAATGEPIGESMKHDGPVNSARFSPDGQRVVTASWDKTAKLWDATTGKQIGESMEHDGPVNSARFSPDGQRVVTASRDKTARLWDTTAQKPIGESMKHDGPVDSAQFSADGLRVVTCSDKEAKLWHGATGERIGESMKHDGRVNSAKFSPDGRRVVTASADKTARLWDSVTGKPIGGPMRHDGEVAFAHFSPDSQRVVTISRDNTARLWKATTGIAIDTPMRHDGQIISARFSPDGQRVVTASLDKRARLWDAMTGKPIAEPMEHDNSVLSAEFSSDGQWVVTAASDNTLRKWDGSPTKPFSEPLKHGYGVSSAQFSPEGYRVVTIALDNAARLWDAAGNAIGPPMKHKSRILSTQFSADGQRVVTASSDNAARLWDGKTGEPIGESMNHDGPVNCAQFSPGGQRIVTASEDHTARIWESAVNQAVGAPLMHKDKVFSAQFCHDGQRVVTASLDESARLWDAATGKPIGESMNHDGPVVSAQFSPDGQRVVTASSDKTARMWEGKTGTPIGKSMSHNSQVVSARFSPDGRCVITASSNNTARLWDGNTAKRIGEPMKHGGKVSSAEFSPDGRLVVTACSDGTARMWHGKTGKPIGDPVQHQDEVTSARFSPDGQRIATASLDHTAQLWDIPTVTTKDTPEDVLLLGDLAEAMAGVALPDPGEADIIQVLSASEVNTRREKIYARLGTKSSELTPLQRYLKWSVTQRKGRTISPFSPTAFVEWIEHTIDEGTLADLRAAMKADPANARLAAQLGRRLADQKELAEADFQIHRAAKLAPADTEIIKLCTEIENLLQPSAE